MVPLCSMVPLDTQACWLMECLLLLIWPSIQRIPVEMLLWPRCQGQRGVIWSTTFFHEIDSYGFLPNLCFFEMVKMRSRRSGWGQLVPSVLIWFFLKNHYISIRVCKSQFQPHRCVWMWSLGLSESRARWLTFWSILSKGYPLCRCVLGKGQGRGQKTEVDVPWHFDASVHWGCY